MRVVGLATHQSKADLATLHLGHHAHAVADGSTDLKVRVLPREDRKQGGKQMFAGDGTGGQEQFSGGRRGTTGNSAAGLPVECQDSLRVLIEFLPRLGEQNSTSLPLEYGGAERFLESLHALADRGLAKAEGPSGRAETAKLRSLGEGIQVW